MPMVNAFLLHPNAMGTGTVLMGAMRPQSYVGPTARMYQVEGLPVRMVNAYGKKTNVMEASIVVMPQMRPQRYVETTARR